MTDKKEASFKLHQLGKLFEHNTSFGVKYANSDKPDEIVLLNIYIKTIPYSYSKDLCNIKYIGGYYRVYLFDILEHSPYLINSNYRKDEFGLYGFCIGDSVVKFIENVFDSIIIEKKKENNMNKITEEATKELCHIIAYEAYRSPLRWTDVRDDSAVGCDSIYIYNNSNTDSKVCKVRIYETSLKNSPSRAYYYVYFTDKYSSVAKDIKDSRIADITGAEGYKFLLPRHVVDFVREVVRLKEEGGVLKDCKTEVVDRMERARCCGKTAFQMFQCYRESLGIMDWLDIINRDSIEDVIFNDPATIIIWADGSKTVVKAENEPFDPEKGLAMAISKKVLGNKYDYYDVFKKYVGRYEKKQKKGKK